MKKKIVALCLVLALALTAIGGATLAYFTDTEEATNTFTFGNVDIELDEKGEKDDELVDWEAADKELMPGKANAVTKEAKIINTGDNEAWVWAEVLIPASLDDADGNSPAAPGLGNSLHFNFPAESTVEWGNGKWIMQHNADGLSHSFAGTETIGTVLYNKFVLFYNEKLAKDAETSLFLSQVYMDKDCTQCPDGHENCMILRDGETHYAGDWELIVRAYAIQDSGFATVIDAWKAYDGE